MKKLLSMAAGAVIASVAVATSAFATYDYGQIASGDIYRVRNVSDNQTSFEKTTNADLCETVQFKVRVHNAGPKPVSNVNVKATLSSGVSTSHSSTVTITANNNYNNNVATGTAGVSLSKAGSIAYVNGSTELLDNAGNRLNTLGDTILTSGVNLGEVAVSTNNMRFVQFKAKMNCEPVVKNIEVCELATKKIITIREDQFDASKHSTNPNDCKEVVKYIKVCELASKNIITIDEKAYDAAKHSKNLADCAAKPPVPGEIVVCETATKKIVTIKENEFDSSKHTKDLSKCAAAPVVVTETPTELPQTGATGVLAIVASVIAAAAGYVVTARKNVLG
ncbi:MAG: hypothetical protein V4678_04700 [Patescibacteria group bacterium]